MTITRMADGKVLEFELTNDEMLDAYKEKRADFYGLDVIHYWNTSKFTLTDDEVADLVAELRERIDYCHHSDDYWAEYWKIVDGVGKDILSEARKREREENLW